MKKVSKEKNMSSKERRWPYLIIVLPADGVWRFGAEPDDARQIDGTAHSNEDFTASQDRRAWL